MEKMASVSSIQQLLKQNESLREQIAQLTVLVSDQQDAMGHLEQRVVELEDSVYRKKI